MENFIAALVSISSVCTALSAGVIAFFKIEGKGRQPIALAISIIVGFLGVYLNVIPSLFEPLWLSALAEGILIGFVSNGIADIEFIKKLLKLFYPSSTVTITADAPEKDTAMSRLMKLQNELSKYITLENGKVSITVKKEGNYNKEEK